MRAFTKILTPQEAKDAFARVFAPAALDTARVLLGQSLHRILAQTVAASSDLPAFDRSTVDGYAVRAVNTTRASATAAITLQLVGEVLMGDQVKFAVGEGQAARIPTGGMMPTGADAVVMQEHTVRQDALVAIERAAKVGENVVPRGSDAVAGAVLLSPGRRLRPQDLGLLAGLGVSDVLVYRRPRVGIIVTGDELVAPGQPLHGSGIYDMNTYTLASLVEEAGGEAVLYGIVPDNLALLTERAKRAFQMCDVLLLAGGSSVGEKDFVANVIGGLGEPGIVVHGIAIRPGRPTILAVADGKPVFGLPGNVVSAIVIFDHFVRPVVQAVAGLQERSRPGGTVRARLTQKVTTGDREDHLRVSLAEQTGLLRATPLPTGSALITSMVRADGIVVVPPHTAWDEGTEVEVRVLP
ncbi:MAG TPA: gephyrin-like molybdotransferase Glp [bacterium]